MSYNVSLMQLPAGKLATYPPNVDAAELNADASALDYTLSPSEITSISVVIPVYNERESLSELHRQLSVALDALPIPSEVILVDDGSRDGSANVLAGLSRTDERVRVIRLRRNFGQTAAFAAGFDLAQGDVVITMDADLQNDPADIGKLLDKVSEGYDVVSGWRIDRQDTYLTRKLPSQIANGIISKVTGVKLNDYGCSLKAYRREVLENIQLYGEMHRFIPALTSWMGVEVAEVPVNHSARQFGQSKYGIGRTIRVILDLLTVKFLLGYATRPIQIFGLAGLISFGSGSAIATYLAFIRLVFLEPLSDRPLLLLAVLLIVLGIQFLIMGLIGELLVRVYYESQNKPTYVIREII